MANGTVTSIFVPYHLDEHLPLLDTPLPPDRSVTVGFDGDDPWARLAQLQEPLAAAVHEVVRGGDRPLVLSGDCVAALGAVAGLQRAGLDPAIVWIDAHGDLQTPETTTSGYLGGMPLRLLVGYRPELIGQTLGLRPIADERVTLVGARDLDPPEASYLRQAAIRRCDVDELAADELPAGDIYLHLDADVVDASELPALLFPAKDGPGLDPVAQAVGRVLDTGRVVGLTVACTWHGGHGAGEQSRPHLTSALARWA
ncbi:MAG: arginase family protein [Micromonosporaceae bacterium]